MGGRDGFARIGAAAIYALPTFGCYWLTRMSGAWAVVGWVFGVCFASVMLMCLFAKDLEPTPHDVVAEETPRLTPAEVERLADSRTVQGRIKAVREVSELLAVSAIRAQMEDALMLAAGTSPQSVLTLGQATRGSLASFLLAEAHQYRDLEPEDAMFLSAVTGDIWESSETPDVAWRFINYMSEEDWAELGEHDLSEWVRLFEECGLYNRAAGDTTTSTTGIRMLTRLVSDFHRPWPAADDRPAAARQR